MYDLFLQILVVPTIALLQFLFFGIKTEHELMKTMLFMILGVGVATMTEMKLSIFGLLIAFSGVLMTAIYQIVSKDTNRRTDIVLMLFSWLERNKNNWD
jgi:hypothetical protein